MKTLSAAVLLSLSMGLSNLAIAEPFNDRGPDWVKNIISTRPTATYSESYAIRGEQGFNNRGEDWVSKLTPSATRQSPDQCPLNEQLATHRGGFKDKYNFHC